MPSYLPQRTKISMPIGTVIQTLSPKQDNWLLCNGATVDAVAFPELKALVDSLSMNSKVPDLMPRKLNGDKYTQLTPGQAVDFGTYVPHYIIAKLEGGILASV